MLIGREKEQESLRSALRDEESTFLAVYGRRRVGKTFLVRETFEGHFTFYHTGLAKSPMKKQLAAWRSSLRDYGAAQAQAPRTWIDAFDALKDIIRQSEEPKKVVFIDEMPWMDTQRSGFVAALEHFWNGWASARRDVVLIVCGSATSWIINNVIKNHGGLHNRVGIKVHLQPFTLRECELYAAHRRLGMSRRQLMECYMVMGGVPFYWSKLRRQSSLAQNIDALFFAPDGELRGEFGELYASLFRTPEPYIKAVAALGTKRAGLTREQIIAHGKLADNGQLSEVLENLEACGFVRRYQRFGQKTQNAIFQLVDPYTLFYYRFIHNAPSNYDEHYWSAQTGSPAYYNWCGLAFERVCLLHLAQIKRALGISGIAAGACSWQSRREQDGAKAGAQIDLVVDRSDNVVDLCEMKFTLEPYAPTRSDCEKMAHRRALFIAETATRKAVHTVLVAAAGVAENQFSGDFQAVVSGEALFAE